MILSFRRRFPNGYERHQYLVYEEDHDPANDPQLEVKPGDEMIQFLVINQENVIREWVRDHTNTGWIQKNHWDYIAGKPSEFYPEMHDFYGNRHSGRRPLPEDEHTLTNITHQQMMAIPLAFTF